MNYGIWDIKGKYWITEFCNKASDQYITNNLNFAYSFLEICNGYYVKFDKKLTVKIMEQR